MNSKVLGKMTRAFWQGEEDLEYIVDDVSNGVSEKEDFEKCDLWYDALQAMVQLEGVVLDKIARGNCVHDSHNWLQQLRNIRKIKRAMAMGVGVDIQESEADLSGPGGRHG